MTEFPMLRHTCSNPDCRVAETGNCLEGLGVDECPNCTRQSTSTDVDEVVVNEVVVDEVEADEVEADVGDISICSGDSLSIDEATAVLCSGQTRVVAVVGPSNSGKTTFGLSLYQSFQNGPFHSWSFGGSLTLSAFEERCHHARLACGKTTPDTPRTSLDAGLRFMHIAVHSEQTGRVNLLFSDRSGEFYEMAVDNEKYCKDLHEISRADYVLILIDGKKLANERERQAVKQDVMLTIDALLQGGALHESHCIGIVLTKYDIVLAPTSDGKTETFFDKMMDKLRQRYSSRLSGIHDFRVAARSENDCVKNMHGILEVIEESLRRRSQSDYIPSPVPLLDRWFWRFNNSNEGLNES